MALATRIPRPASAVQTEAARPKRTSLAQAIAWSSSLKRWTVTTGPKTSSWTISLLLVGAGDDGRLVVGARAVGALAAGHDLGAVARPLDHALDLVGLGLAMSEPISMSSPSAGSPHLMVLTWSASSATNLS